MPWSADGACRLAGALLDVDEQPPHPLTVWWWDVDASTERRGVLHGWRGGDGGRLALVVTRGPGDACTLGRDCLRWIPAHLVRDRRE
jgi:hypothetical protein